MKIEISGQSPTLACLGAASVAAICVGLLEVGLALHDPNALVQGLPPLLCARYLAMIVCLFPMLALPSALLGAVLARFRPALGRAVAAALPGLFVALESLRHAHELRGSDDLWLGLLALLLSLLLTPLALLRERLLPDRTALWTTPLGLLLVAGLWLWSPTLADARAEDTLLESTTLPPAADALRARNLLVLLVDTLRADHLGCYGYPRPTSPRIDALAREATLFENAATPKPKTSPAIASLFTGTWPHTHQVHRTRTELVEENVTLAESLKQAGLTTFGLSANINISAPFGFGQGFDELRWVRKKTGPDGAKLLNNAERLSDQTIEWLEQHQHERFFAYIQFIDPHSPYRPPGPFDAGFEGDSLDGRLGAPELKVLDRDYIDGLERSIHLPELAGDLDHYVRRYDGEILYTDGAIGEILDALERLGLSDDTVVVFTSDHGESMTEHNAYFNHGLFPYEEQVHIPLVIRGPGIAAGKRRLEQVSLVALMPTLLELLGVSPPEQVETDSFAALLQVDTPPGRGRPTLLSARAEKRSMASGLRTNRWKYVLNPKRRSPAEALELRNLALLGKRLRFSLEKLRNAQLEEELYDLQADPGELVNLAYRRPEIVVVLRRHLDQLSAAARPVKQQPRVFSRAEFNAEARQALQQLGYLGK